MEPDPWDRLEVSAPDKTAPKGSYEIKIKERRPATAQDKSAVAGERLFAEAIRYWQLAGQSATERSAHAEARHHFTKALELLRNALHLDPKLRPLAKTEADFHSLRGHPEFRRLLQG